MPPTLFLVRHAEGHHNVNGAVHIRDATLTDKGRSQCRALKDSFAHHDTIDLVIASPMRRTIQTSVLAFTPTLARKEVPFLLRPQVQEVTNHPCDVGHPLQVLEEEIESLVEGADGFDVAKINWNEVVEGWNSKAGYWAPEADATRKRAADLRTLLFQRSENTIVVVTHGGFLHYLTEDWTGDDPSRGTAYLNCEVRQFVFTPGSSVEDAHISETSESRKTRGAKLEESDPHVLEGLKEVESKQLSQL